MIPVWINKSQKAVDAPTSRNNMPRKVAVPESAGCAGERSKFKPFHRNPNIIPAITTPPATASMVCIDCPLFLFLVLFGVPHVTYSVIIYFL